MKNKTDIVIVVPPRIKDDYGYTPAGPAALKGSLTKAGYTSKIVDYNSLLDETYSGVELTKIENFFMYYNLYNAAVFEQVDAYLTSCAENILAHNPTWVGISVFSYNSHRATRLLSIKIKQLNPTVKIVIGGGGIATDFSFPAILKKERIIDEYIRGEGELALVSLLDGDTSAPGISGNPAQQIEDISSLAFPDYSDYTLRSYENSRGLIAIPITGSRGCVAHCSFCDVAKQWPTYRFRTGIDIANEIKSHYAQYSALEYRFTDSLVNGSMSAFRDMCKYLAEYRSTLDDDKKFIWDGHFIIRGERVMKPEDFDMMAASGAQTLLLGVESGSQAVRDHMQKKYTDDDLAYTLAQLSRVGVKCRMLMIIGYPTETDADFNETLDMFTRHAQYAHDGTVEEVNLGLTLNLLPGTPLDDNKEANNLIKMNNHINDWVCTTNPTLTYKERLKRRIFTQKHIHELGYRVFEDENYRKQLFSSLAEVNSMDVNSETAVSDFQFDSQTNSLKAIADESTDTIQIIQFP